MVDEEEELLRKVRQEVEESLKAFSKRLDGIAAKCESLAQNLRQRETNQSEKVEFRPYRP